MSDPQNVEILIVLRESLATNTPVSDLLTGADIADVKVPISTSSFAAFDKSIKESFSQRHYEFMFVSGTDPSKTKVIKNPTFHYYGFPDKSKNFEKKPIQPDNFARAAKSLQAGTITRKIIVLWKDDFLRNGVIRHKPFEDRLERLRLAYARIKWAKHQFQQGKSLPKRPVEGPKDSYTWSYSADWQRIIDIGDALRSMLNRYNTGKWSGLALMKSEEMKEKTDLLFGLEHLIVRTNSSYIWPSKENLTMYWRI